MRYATQTYPAYEYQCIGLIVYAAQIPWTIYGVTLIWREGPTDYLYKVPDVIPMTANVTFIITCILNIAWFFLWDRGILIAEIIMLLLCALAMATCMGAALKAFELNGSQFEAMGYKADFYYNTILVHNGIAAITAWFFLESCLHAGVVAHYRGSMSLVGASVMAMILYCVAILGTIVLHDFVMEHQFHYAFTNYAVWVALLIPILAALKANQGNFIIALVLLIVIIIFFIVKVMRFCRSIPDAASKSPLLSEKPST